MIWVAAITAIRRSRTGRTRGDPVHAKAVCTDLCTRLGEIEPNAGDVADPKGRQQDNRPGQMASQRTGETPETCVVRLITQRSRVQIPPPLPGHRPLPIMGGAFRMVDANGFANDVVAQTVSPRSPLPVLSVMSTEASDPPMISSASAVATWRSTSRSLWTYCFIVNATSAWPIRWLSAFQSIFASRPAVA